MKDLEHLVRYLDGELNEVEKKQLIERLRNDPSLSEKISLIKDVDQMVGDKYLSSFEESLKEVEGIYFNRNTGESNRKTRKNLIITRIAAVAFVIISTTAYFLLTKDSDPGDQNALFATYYQKMDADFTTRSGVAPDDDFIKAIKLYNNNNFKGAIVEFKKLLISDPSNNAAKLFLGICYTETNQLTEATRLFSNILKEKDPIFEEHAAWYLSLCYVKTGKSSQAKPILNGLIQSRSYYYKKAFELLKQLP